MTNPKFTVEKQCDIFSKFLNLENPEIKMKMNCKQLKEGTSSTTIWTGINENDKTGIKIVQTKNGDYFNLEFSFIFPKSMVDKTAEEIRERALSDEYLAAKIKKMASRSFKKESEAKDNAINKLATIELQGSLDPSMKEMSEDLYQTLLERSGS